MAFGFISCKKCKTCTTYVRVEEPGQATITTSTSADYCKDDYDDAPENSTVTTQQGNTYIHTEINCVEK